MPVFTDAPFKNTYGQLVVSAGLTMDDLATNVIFHLLSWMSHRCERPVKTVPGAKTSVFWKAVDKAKGIPHVVPDILLTSIKAYPCADTKDLSVSIFTQRNSAHRSTTGYFDCLKVKLQSENVEAIAWKPCTVDQADVFTKHFSPLAEVFQLTLYTKRLNILLQDAAETKSSHEYLGSNKYW